MKKVKKEVKSSSGTILKEALYEKALGYDSDEIVEEYTIDENGDEKKVKKKITKKHYGPDIPAAKVLLEYFINSSTEEYENMTEEQLRNEKLKLIKLLEGDKE